MLHKKVLLIILDGWGIGKKNASNPILKAKTPNLDGFIRRFPHSRLKASGQDVGLPDGVMGNSEVGHLTLGAGRVIAQDLVKINTACRAGSLAGNPALQDAFKKAKRRRRRLHFIGLVSDAGVHSMNTHLYKICDLAKQQGLKEVFVHALTDGRDTDPHSGLGYIAALEKQLRKSGGVIATLMGRYYLMDRDKRWARIKIGYEAIIHGQGKRVENIGQGIKESYRHGVTDEFIKPLIRVDENRQPVGLIRPDDVVICFNFRTERLREITTVLTQKNFPQFGMRVIPLHFYTMTEYDHRFRRVKVLFRKENIRNTLGEVIARNRRRQLRLAETEKYAHVTFFFSGGREEKFNQEWRKLIPSPKVATYNLRPAMSAPLIAAFAAKEMAKKKFDFICLNFANGDMVGHTGIFPAIIKAVESVDTCLGIVINAARQNGYEVLLTADHGNAEAARNKDGSPHTSHSLNPVPCLLISDRYRQIKSGSLSNVAPTILKIMGLKIPKEMTGRTLV
jgi:2,3-bisphosphoglycerate-independent phosphoglycerate mutase